MSGNNSGGLAGVPDVGAPTLKGEGAESEGAERRDAAPQGEEGEQPRARPRPDEGSGAGTREDEEAARGAEGEESGAFAGAREGGGPGREAGPTPRDPDLTTESSPDSNGRTKTGQFAKDNPYRFEKGKSGNPKGRPSGQSITSVLRRMLDEQGGANAVAQSMLDLAMKGNRGSVEAARLILDRVEGPVSRKLELDGTVHHKTVYLDSAVDAEVIQPQIEEGEPDGEE